MPEQEVGGQHLRREESADGLWESAGSRGQGEELEVFGSSEENTQGGRK